MTESQVYTVQSFDQEQMAEIEEGSKKNLNVALYARPEFLAIQMRQIRLGLEEKLPAQEYANPEYDWFQMEEIRKGMQNGMDYRAYAMPSVEYRKMRQIRKGLQAGVNLVSFMKLDVGILRELRKSIEKKVNIVEYIKDGYDVEQLREIRHGLEENLNIETCCTKEFRGAAIREICLGLKSGVDVSVYARVEYNWQQMREIRLGLEHRIEAAQYANRLYNWQQMREIRLGLEDGLEVSSFKSLMYIAKDMQKIRLQMEEETLHLILEQNDEIISYRDFMVEISRDQMKASIKINGSKEDEITAEEIRGILKEKGIISGLLEEEIALLAEKRKYNQVLTVAEGKMPEQGKDGWYEFFFRTEVDHSPKILEDGSVDYSNIRWYELVEKEQKIAYYHEAQEGTAGYTVTGMELPAKKGKEQPILSGRGFRVLEDGRTYISLEDGKIELEENQIEITRLYILEEVTRATGNIEFDGSVYVKGNVGTGARITAAEDIIINGFVEGAFLKCEREILLRQGVNGNGEGSLEAGSITGKFFEAVHVVSQGDIQANYCMNSELYAEGKIIISGTKGMIVGGTAHALKGIVVHNVGNKTGISTTLQVGMDDTIFSDDWKVEKKLAEVGKELAILGSAYMDFQRKYPGEVLNTMEMYLKIESAIYTKEKEQEKWYKKKQKIDEMKERIAGGKIVINGTLHDGSNVYVNRVKWGITNISNVVLRYEKGEVKAYANR